MVNGRDPVAHWLPTNNIWSGRAGYTPIFIVCHCTGGGDAENWLRRPDAGASAHYVVKRSGYLYQLVDENDTAWANGAYTYGHKPIFNTGINGNYITISIEFENNQYNSDPLTAAQIATGIALIKRICARWGIRPYPATSAGGLIGHNDLDPVHRSLCPGPAFPWSTIYAGIKEEEEEEMNVEIGKGIGTHFQLRGEKWYCTTTKIELFGHHLKYWRSMGGAGGLPLTGELPYKNGKVVFFERWVQMYDPDYEIDNPPIDPNQAIKTVYLMHITNGYAFDQIIKKVRSELNSKINALESTNKVLQDKINNIPEFAELEALKNQIAGVTTLLDAQKLSLRQVGNLSSQITSITQKYEV